MWTDIVIICLPNLCIPPAGGALTLHGPILTPFLTLRGKYNLFYNKNIIKKKDPPLSKKIKNSREGYMCSKSIIRNCTVRFQILHYDSVRYN